MFELTTAVSCGFGANRYCVIHYNELHLLSIWKHLSKSSPKIAEANHLRSEGFLGGIFAENNGCNSTQLTMYFTHLFVGPLMK
jgi:hypothetical protein